MKKDDDTEYFSGINKKISILSNMVGDDIVSGGKITDAIANTTDNMVKDTKVSSNEKEAITQEKFEHSLIGMGIDKDTSDEEIEHIIDKYTEKIFDIILK